MASIADTIRANFDVRQDDGDQWLVLCPWHGDTSPSLRIDTRRGVFICYACGAAGGKRQLYERLGLEESGGVELDALKRRYEALRAPVEVSGLPTMPESHQAAYTAVWTDYWTEVRGFSEEVVAKVGLGFDLPRSQGMIPVRQSDGTLSNFIRRAIGPTNGPKYLYPKGLPISRYLWGDWLVPSGEVVVITEGTLDAVAMMDAGFHTVSLLGRRMSRHQEALLMDLAPRSVVMCLDNDRAGKEATLEIAPRIAKKVPVRVVDWRGWDAKDPGEMDPTDRPTLMEEAVAFHRWYAR